MNDLITPKFARQLVAELLGTFLLALVVNILVFGKENYGASFAPVFGPFAVGLTVAVLVALFGGISGANLNPAVTLGLLAIRKVQPVQAVGYLVVQVLGAFAALYLTTRLVGDTQELAFKATSYAWWGEAAGAFILVLSITAAVIGKLKPLQAAPLIGAGLAVGATVSSLSSGAILNPALALSMGARSLPYLTAPILGSIAAAVLYAWLGRQEPATSDKD